MAVSKVILNGSTLIDVTQKTVTSGKMLSGTTALKNDGTDITGNIASRSSSDLTASGATVTAPAGYYSSSASKSVASGTAGTPTATKGTVSNHSVSVTPSVTNTTGYITGGTKNGTAVSVSASELVSGTKTISSSGTTDVTNYASASVSAGSATTPTTTITANPTISVSSGGLITASVSAEKSITPTVSAGYVSSGTAGTATVSGSATNQLTVQAAQTIHPSTTDQTIASGKYLTGAQTVKGVLLTNLTADNIKKDVVVKVGDSTDDDCVASVTGTLETSSGGSSYTLLASKEFEVNTTSTTTTDIPDSTIVCSRTSNTAKILYIKIRDKNGKRQGYFYGGDCYWKQPIGGSLLNNYKLGCVYRVESTGYVACTSSSPDYGLFVSSPPSFSTGQVTLTMKSRYNSSYTGTVDGTYTVEVYDLEWPNNVSPFD